ncbi:vacuolar protein 8-like [Sesamum indicum]|uniref:Vacuolar protein 8-like n=1 Tax=Sesamum indicum TaxID=4182 RepID=A0A6I9U617_SESIN|nr:vacuolar protein 8-like [Sesamum indicum]
MGEVKKSTTRDQSSAEETKLHQAIVLISSLISLSNSIKVFPTKWQSIGNKLEALLSNLTAIENCQSTDNFSLSITLETIVATLKSCGELGKQCSELSYSGKLLMQSDLDIVSAKIDAHIKSISDIYAMGLLTQNNAIVVSRPCVSASSDDIKFYIVDLLSRFKIGSTDMKKQALVAFNEVIQEDDRYLKVALELDSFVTFLVNFLDLKDGEIQEEAAKAASLIAGFESYKSVLIGAGIIAPLIRVLESGSDQSKKFAARCLVKATENSDNVWSVSAHGGVTVRGNTGEHDGELVGLACGVLKNLVGVEEIRRFVVEEGAILEFVNLLRSKNEVIKICSVDLLQAMAYGDESIRDMIIQGGGIRAIVRALDPRSSFSTKTRKVAFRGIVNICCSSEKSLTLLINYGFMDHILYFLRYGEVPVQELALKAAFWLSETSEEGKKVMGEAGFMPVLVKFLDSNSLEIREVAAETLSSMIIVPRNRKRFVQNDQNVGLLLQMLDPMEVNTGNKRLLLSILMSLTRSNSARKKIANSGYLKNIEKLAEAEVSDAKKIVKKLSSNRLRSILGGFWQS